MGTWPHMATVLVPIYGPYGLPISFLDLSNGEEYASPGKEIWRQRMELIPQKALPAQPVDATPSNQLIRHYFPWRTDLFGCTRSKPSQANVPADLI